MLYFGRVGNGYFWAIEGRNAYYLYERSSRTKWKTVYKGKVSLGDLVKIFGRMPTGARPAVPSHWYDVLRSAVGALLLRLSPRERNRFVQEYGDLLDYFGFELDDDG